MLTLRSRFAFAVLAIIVAVSPNVLGQGGNAPSITGTVPSSQNTTLTINGANLGTTRPGVVLGTQALTVTSFTNTAIVAGLPVAARSGTLVNRYGGTPLAGSLAAKTGWIDCA